MYMCVESACGVACCAVLGRRMTCACECFAATSSRFSVCATRSMMCKTTTANLLSVIPHPCVLLPAALPHAFATAPHLRPFTKTPTA